MDYQAGKHSIEWDTSKLSSGSYVLKLTARGTTSVQRVTVVR